MGKTRRAYTLFEVILVLVLLATVAILAFPQLDNMGGPFRLTQAADMVRARWAQARAQAINEGRAYRFALVSGKGNFRIAPDSPDYWSGGEPPADPGSSTPPLVLEETLPKGVRFVPIEDFQGSSAGPAGDAGVPSSGDDHGPWSNAVTFLPDGTASEDKELVFTTTGAQPIVVKLRALTGAATVRKLATDANR